MHKYIGINYARDRIKETKQSATIIIFDLLFYLKAKKIVVSREFEDVIVRLDDFHTLMSYLGCIDYLLASSGLKELLSFIIYASISVDKRLSGHACASAVRANIMLRRALTTLIFPEIELTGEGEKEVGIIISW